MICDFMKDCPDEVSAFCSECRPQINLCLEHSKQHLAKSEHYPTRYDSKLLEKNKAKLIKQKLKDLERLVIQETSAIIKKVNSVMKKTLIELKKINRNLKSLKEFTFCDIDKSKFTSIFNDIESLFLLSRKSPQDQCIDDYKIYDFKKGTNILFCFDTEKLTYDSKTINSLESQRQLITIYKISSEKLFLYGGFSNSYSNKAYFVDLRNFTFKNLQPWICRDCASGELAMNKLYVFGGRNNSGSIKNSDYFDLNNETWSSIQELPYQTFCASTTNINNIILITSGDANKLFNYYINSNSYEEIFISFSLLRHMHFLIKYKDKVFLVTNQNSYLASPNDLKYWVNVSSNDSTIFSDASISKPVIRGDNAYFVIYPSKILCFNCTNYTLKTIILMD